MSDSAFYMITFIFDRFALFFLINILESIDLYHYNCYNENIFILKRQEDSDLYRSEMNCRQPVRAENRLTSQKCNDKI